MRPVGVVLLAVGLLLQIVRLPLIGLKGVRRPQPISVHGFLDIVIEEQRSGQTAFMAVSSALAAFDRDQPSDPDQVPALIEAELPAYAALWRLLYHRGAGLFDAAVTLRSVEEERAKLTQELDVKVAGTRSTMRLLLWLPWAFLIIGEITGFGSMRVLLTNLWGYPLIAIAAGLSWLGFRWVNRILDEALA